MAAATNPSANRHEQSVALTRLFDAPRERVFAAWITAERRPSA